MGTRARKLLAATAAITMVLGAGGAAGAQDPDAGSIAEVATEDGRFTTLLTALDLAGLSEMFTDCDGGPYTVLAPTDDAFTATLEALQLEATDLIADQELLTSVLTYHVIDGAVASDAVAGLDGSSATTLNGEDIDIAVDGDSISIGSGNPTAANVVAADVQACNGIIHAIDAVLVPPTVASGLGLGQEDGGDGAADDGAADDGAADDGAADDGAADDGAADDGGDDGELAVTGAGSDTLTVVALALVAGGVLVLATGRRLRTLR